jgi:hypothetical protein
LLFVFAGINGCFRYYKPTSVSVETEEEKLSAFNSAEISKRYLILRSGDRAYHIANFAVSAGKQALDLVLDTVDMFHQEYISSNNKPKKFKYLKNDPISSSVLHEAHLYIQPADNLSKGNFQLALNKITKLELIQFDRQKGDRKKAVTILAMTGITVVLVSGIIALSDVTAFH